MKFTIIGNSIKIQSNTDVWDEVVLEDYVFIGPSVVFTNGRSPRAKYPKKKRTIVWCLSKRRGYHRG